VTAAAELMPIPLWHGTSSWYLPGVLEHGLGAVDVHAQLRSREFYRAAWELRLALAEPEDRAELERYYGSRSRAIMGDPAAVEGFNFRYGQLYVTGEERKAVTYAARGYGSELVRLGAALLKQIREASPEKASALLSSYPEIAACLEHEHKPIVIRLDRIERRWLRLETGAPIITDLDRIMSLLSFELVKSVDPSAMTVFEVRNVELRFIGAVSYDLVPAFRGGPVGA